MAVSVWGREYLFAGLPVPVSVRTTPARYSTGEAPREPVELLHSPMAFRLRVDGQVPAWTSEPFAIVETTDERIVFESRNRAGGVVIKGTTTVEFDGLVRIDLEVGPEAGSCRIDSLEFVIPFRKETAVLLGNFRTAPGPGQAVDRYLGFLPALPWTYPVFYAQTVGTDRFGLQWVCDSTRDWRLGKPQQACELRRVGNSVEEVFRFVDYPVEVEKPLRITFGLMALPVKPLPADWGRARIASSSFAPPPLDDGDAVRDYFRMAGYAKPHVELAHNPGWTGTPWYPYFFSGRAELEAMKSRVDLAHQAGLKYCPHSGWQAISTLIPEWQTFGREMAIAPETETIGQTVFACYNSPYSEFTAMLWDHHARMVGIDGVKADTMFPQTPCASVEHGCGWRDERGALWPSVNVFATRDFFKRLYRIFHGGVREHGVLSAAQTGVPIAPVCSFADVVLISEGWPYHKAHTLKEGYPQDLVRTLMVGAPYGVMALHDLKGAPLNAPQRTAALLVAGADPRLMVHPGHYVRGYLKRPPSSFNYTSPVLDIWDTWDWIDRGGAAIWRPHWENADVLQVRAPAVSTGGTAELYGSLYVQPGRKIVLIVANYEREPVTAEARLDLAALGFDPAARLQAEDAVTRVPVALDGDRLAVGVLSERYRMIRIWDGEAPRYADERLGPDRLADGGFEAWDEQEGAVRDPLAFAGRSSLRLAKTAPAWEGGVTAALPAVELEPGDYAVQGYVRVDEPLAPARAEDGASMERFAAARVTVSGPAVAFDPPRWASQYAGQFFAEEPTPGWERFLIAFTIDQTQPVTVNLSLGGVGSARFDAVSLRKVERP